MSRHARKDPSATSPIVYFVIVIALLISATAAWFFAFTRDSTAMPVNCYLPDSGPVVSSAMLIGENPAPPSNVGVRVLNANGQSGQATVVSETLQSLGFARVDDNAVGNDPLTPSQNLNCHGQLRFGAEFNSHAATLHALFPCFELVHDARTEGNVDVVLGKGFKTLDDSGPVHAVMQQLNNGEVVDSATLSSLVSRTCD
ncbi:MULTISPECIES: LytR C-terminal domain-containing protein [unclassified Corynebacterium]|uniref:LytR C-terminal domain-containing protein n=1 Tax=unclassified Corynebacterium TaxID=2624378 RepID=UPI00309FCB66